MKKITYAISGFLTAVLGVNIVFAAPKSDFQSKIEKSVVVDTMHYLSVSEPTDTLDCEHKV